MDYSVRGFVGSEFHHEESQPLQMREEKPWSFDVDIFGFANVLHTALTHRWVTETTQTQTHHVNQVHCSRPSLPREPSKVGFQFLLCNSGARFRRNFGLKWDEFINEAINYRHLASKYICVGPIN